jgi:shikimate dehydrogenase
MNESAVFALFGNPVAQSLSPLMHGAAFAQMGFKATYSAYQVNDAADVVHMIREREIRGASITIPFKETVMGFLDDVDKSASAIGAVNTIVNRDGRLKGYNTDGPGLIHDLA